MDDPKYCYENGTLKNKKGIRDKRRLLAAEINYVTPRLYELEEEPVKGKFDFAHLKEIHRRIFQDIYAWAGQPRTVDIAKGNLFCRSQFIDSYAADVFRHYFRDCYAAKGDRHTFVRVLAECHADLNALHPFREGNGRSGREFAREVCLACGYSFDLTRTCHEEMLQASILSFNGDAALLTEIFEQAISPLNRQK